MEEILEKPIINHPDHPYLDWIKMGKKTFEGRLKTKLKDWNLTVGKKLKFYDQDDPSLFTIIEITDLPIFADFGEAFDALGENLIPERTREEVINMYNDLFHYPNETLVNGQTSHMIRDLKVVAIKFIVLN